MKVNLGFAVLVCVGALATLAYMPLPGTARKQERKAGKGADMKMNKRFIVAFVTFLAWAAGAAAQTVVLGTNDPETDVKAVQRAVDQGGKVILKGQFSFNRSPAIPTATAFVGGLATVVVSKAVEISGTQEDDGEMASIEGGTTPFYVDAPGARVMIHGLRFIRPKGDAIFVYAVSGLVIASCKIEGVEPLPGIGGDGIDIATSGGIPVPTNPGKPENISGALVISDNDIDVAGGTAVDNTVGVLIFSVGVPDAKVEAYVSRNKIKNTTEPAVNFRRVEGRVYVERNVIATGSVSSQNAPGPEVIRVANTGSYLIAHNSIECRWADPGAKGIGVFSQLAGWPMEGAIVVDNDVTMSPPEGAVFGPGSGAIDIRGFAQGNVVLNNRIHGSARAGLSVDVFKGGAPDNNSLVLNGFEGFEASVADIYVADLVSNTRIVGPGTIEDHGVGTVIEPVPF